MWSLLVQDPTCAKVSVSGHLKQVPLDLLATAEKLLFARHPAMQDWPKGHAFHMWGPCMLHPGCGFWELEKLV